MWSAAKFNKAVEGGYYIRVTDEAGKKTTGKRSLSGAVGAWTKPKKVGDNISIFVPQYRITGTPDNIRYALVSAGQDPVVVEQAIASAITSANYVNHPSYTTEMNTIEAGKKSKVKPEPAYPNDWLVLFEHILKKDPGSVSYESSTGESKAVKTTKGRSSLTKTLTAAYAALGPGQYLDVSGIDETGKKYRTVAGAPKRGNKFASTTYKLITDNIPAYENALRILFPGTDIATFAPDINQLTAQITNNKAAGATAARAVQFQPVGVAAPKQATRSPGRPRSPASATRANVGGVVPTFQAPVVPGSRYSPTRPGVGQPGATIAPQVNFVAAPPNTVVSPTYRGAVPTTGYPPGGFAPIPSFQKR
jgi:hypothetical protein